MKSALNQVLADIPEQQRDACCEDIIFAATASTAMHEGVHGLLNSRPDSQLSRGLSTFLDEGVTYALQDINAPVIEPIGSLAPTHRDTDRPEVKQRKELGQKLKPEVKRYLEKGRSVDDAFLTFASTQVKKVIEV